MENREEQTVGNEEAWGSTPLDSSEFSNADQLMEQIRQVPGYITLGDKITSEEQFETVRRHSRGYGQTVDRVYLSGKYGLALFPLIRESHPDEIHGDPEYGPA